MNRLLMWWRKLWGKAFPTSPWSLKSCHLDGAYGGRVDKIWDSYWITSRVNPMAGIVTPKSKKALISYEKKHRPVNGKRVAYSFDFAILSYDFDNAPDWWVLFQDWTRVVKGDSDGNRPITTLEIKSYGDKMYLRHKDSSFQWDTSLPDQSPRNNGEIEIKPFVSYKVLIIITDGVDSDNGNVMFFLDGVVITDVDYQTKSATQWRESVQEIGIYHAGNHNTSYNPDDRLTIQVDNLKREVL